MQDLGLTSATSIETFQPPQFIIDDDTLGKGADVARVLCKALALPLEQRKVLGEQIFSVFRHYVAVCHFACYTGWFGCSGSSEDVCYAYSYHKYIVIKL